MLNEVSYEAAAQGFLNHLGAYCYCPERNEWYTRQYDMMGELQVLRYYSIVPVKKILAEAKKVLTRLVGMVEFNMAMVKNMMGLLEGQNILYEDECAFSPNDRYCNVQNGLIEWTEESFIFHDLAKIDALNLSDSLPHFCYRLEANYHPSAGCRYAPKFCSFWQYYPKQMNHYISHMAAALRNFWMNKAIFVGVGKGNSGKSCLSDVANYIYGDNLAHATVHDLGSDYGLSQLTTKTANLEADMIMGKAPMLAIGRMKSASGGDLKVTVQAKFKESHDYIIKVVFFLFGNAVSELPPGVPLDEWFNRIDFNLFEHIFVRDDSFRAGLKDEIDEIFGLIVESDYHVVLTPTDSEYARQQWARWSDPIKVILEELVEKNELRYVPQPWIVDMVRNLAARDQIAVTNNDLGLKQRIAGSMAQFNAVCTELALGRCYKGVQVGPRHLAEFNEWAVNHGFPQELDLAEYKEFVDIGPAGLPIIDPRTLMEKLPLALGDMERYHPEWIRTLTNLELAGKIIRDNNVFRRIEV